MDVDNDDEYMNAAAAHAAFVVTVSAASMYCLLRHAQHARDANIHKLRPLPEKKSALPIFCTVEHPFYIDADGQFGVLRMSSATYSIQSGCCERRATSGHADYTEHR